MAQANGTQQDAYTALVAQIRETPPLELKQGMKDGDVLIATVDDLPLRGLGLVRSEEASFDALVLEFEAATADDRPAILRRLETLAARIHQIEHFVDFEIRRQLGPLDQSGIAIRAGGQVVVTPDMLSALAERDDELRKGLAVSAHRQGNGVELALLTAAILGGRGGKDLGAGDLPSGIMAALLSKIGRGRPRPQEV